MKPLQHARITAHRYGGKWQDWIAIHDWIERSKAIFPSMQHRVLLHSDFGEWLAVRIHSEAIESEDGIVISTYDLFRDHQIFYCLGAIGRLMRLMITAASSAGSTGLTM